MSLSVARRTLVVFASPGLSGRSRNAQFASAVATEEREPGQRRPSWGVLTAPQTAPKPAAYPAVGCLLPGADTVRVRSVRWSAWPCSGTCRHHTITEPVPWDCERGARDGHAGTLDAVVGPVVIDEGFDAAGRDADAETGDEDAGGCQGCQGPARPR
jgi:hypothetical protein